MILRRKQFKKIFILWQFPCIHMNLNHIHPISLSYPPPAPSGPPFPNNFPSYFHVFNMYNYYTYIYVCIYFYMIYYVVYNYRVDSAPSALNHCQVRFTFHFQTQNASQRLRRCIYGKISSNGQGCCIIVKTYVLWMIYLYQ